MRLAYSASVAALVLAIGGAPADEIPNPEFVNWSKFKTGTSVTQKGTSRVGNMATEFTMTATLVEVGADKLVIESSGAVRLFGGDVKVEPIRREVTKSAVPEPGAPKDGKPAGTFEEGTETLKIGETEVKARWFKFRSESDGVKTEGKTWVSDDVPGLVVKQDMTRVSGVITATDKTELVAFKKP